MTKRELEIAAASAVTDALVGALITKLYYDGYMPVFPHTSGAM